MKHNISRTFPIKKRIMLSIILFLLVFVSCCSSTNYTAKEITESEYLAAYKQYAQYNYCPKSVPKAKKKVLDVVFRQFEVKDSLGNPWRAAWQEFYRDDSVKWISETKQYIAWVIDPSGGPLDIMLDDSLHILKTDDWYNDISAPYHAYGCNGLMASMKWYEDINPQLNINIMKLEGTTWKTVTTYRDSTLRFYYNPWMEISSMEELRSLMFWGPDNTLYLKAFIINPKERPSEKPKVAYRKLSFDNEILHAN